MSDAVDIPIKIGPYHIIKKIGAGGMGAVYHAVHGELQREVALKVLAPNMVRDDKVFRRFRNEARAAAMPHHPNIVIFFEHGEDQGYHYLALELVKGTDVAKIVEKRGPMPVGFALGLMKQAAKALEHAHKHGFVHRDIKPSNFLVTPEKNLKLTDMGLARKLESSEVDRVTRDGTTVGTVDYMAPEQAQDSRQADIRSDIYSLGCTWFHMLTGEVPFPDGTALERLYKHSAEAVPDVRNHNPRIPEDMATVLQKMMAKDPDQRQQTPTELLADLDLLDPKKSVTDNSAKDLGALARSTAADDDLPAAAIPAPAPKRSQPAAALPKREAKPRGRQQGLDPKWMMLGAAGIGGVVVLIVMLAGGGNDGKTKPERAPVVNNPAPNNDPGDSGFKIAIGGQNTKPPEETIDPRIKVESKSSSKNVDSKTTVKPVVDEPTEEPTQPSDVPAPRRATDEPTPPVQPTKPRVVVALSDEQKKELLGPWHSAVTPPARPKLTQLLRRVGGAGPRKSSSTLAEAWQKAAATNDSAVGWIELNDSGPMFCPPIELRAKDTIVVAAGPGYSPTLLLDDSKGTAKAWFNFKGSGIVEFIGVHFVIYVADIGNKADEFDVFRSTGAELRLRRCTFTVLGKRHKGLNIVRAVAPPDHPEQVARVMLENCVARGLGMSALALEAASADVLFDNCFLATLGFPLLRTMPPEKESSTGQRQLRVIDSTLLANRELIRARIDGETPNPLAIWSVGSAWASAAGNARNAMVRLELAVGSKLTDDLIDWHGIRTAYVGWPLLLTAHPTGKASQVLAKNLQEWRARFTKGTGAERSNLNAAFEETFAFDPYPVVADGPFTFGGKEASTGYDPAKCLPLDPNWFERSLGAFTPPPVDLQAPLRENGVSQTVVKLKVNLAKSSLAKELKRNTTAGRLEVELSGKGRFNIEPITLKDQSLVLKFIQEGEPLVVGPKGEGEALFDLRGGSLRIENGRFRWPVEGAAPMRLARVRGGDCKLVGCRFDLPLVRQPANMKEMIRFESDPSEKSDDVRRFIAKDTLFSGTTPLVSVEIPNAVVAVDNCVFAGDHDAIQLTFGGSPSPKWRGLVSLIKNTVSVGGSGVRLGQYPEKWPLPAQPVLVVAQDNLFTDLLDAESGKSVRARMGRVVGVEGDGLARGLLAWQGTNNGFDQRLSWCIAAHDADSNQGAFDTAWQQWTRAWGPRHEAGAVQRQFRFTDAVKSEPFYLASVALAPDEPGRIAASDGKQLGADLTALKVEVKPTTFQERPNIARKDNEKSKADPKEDKKPVDRQSAAKVVEDKPAAKENPKVAVGVSFPTTNTNTKTTSKEKRPTRTTKKATVRPPD